MPRATEASFCNVPTRRLRFEISEFKLPGSGDPFGGLGGRSLGGAVSVFNQVSFVTFDSRSEEALTAWLLENSGADTLITTDKFDVKLDGATPLNVSSSAGNGTSVTLGFVRSSIKLTDPILDPGDFAGF